jgi:polyphosphate kinase
VVRGICMLKAGVPGLSENIRVVSVLGRFLEHSRVFWFRNDGKQKLYISSADWMPRNFFNRVEIAVPIEGAALLRVKEECLDVYLKDNTFAWQLNADGKYARIQASPATQFSAQQFLMNRYNGSQLDH